MARTPIHPGEHLAEELKELSISAAELARQIDVPVNRVTGIINGQRAITADTALRLGHWFGTSPEFWLNLQKLYELRLAREGVGDRVERLPKLTERKHEPRNWTRMTTQGQRRIHHPLRARWFFRRGSFIATASFPEFIDENGGGPGVRLRKRQQKKG
jgi:addiction module HigA family antidote